MLEIQRAIRKKADPKRAKSLQRYFKTGPGEYGEGDVFLGLSVPQCREVAKLHKDLPLKDVQTLLKSEFHEERLIAGLILVQVSSNEKDPKKIERTAKFYLKNTKRFNNWDLVDLTAYSVLGPYFEKRSRQDLYKLARSKNIWERRIAMMTTFYFIRSGDGEDALKIAKILMKDTHDLIHKVSGWMLREVGKRVGRESLLEFLDENAAHMPRTMLRYSLEHLPPAQRLKYMNQKTTLPAR